MPVLILALALAVGNGCSIKEDRSLCPCSLILDFSEVDLSYEGMTEIRITAPDGFLYYDGNGMHMARTGIPETKLALFGEIAKQCRSNK